MAAPQRAPHMYAGWPGTLRAAHALPSPPLAPRGGPPLDRSSRFLPPSLQSAPPRRPPARAPQNKADEDEFTSFGGRAKLEKAIEKTGAKIITRLTNTVTHILMSDEFENTTNKSGVNKGETKHAEWIKDAPGKAADDCELVSENEIKKHLGHT